MALYKDRYLQYVCYKDLTEFENIEHLSLQDLQKSIANSEWHDLGNDSIFHARSRQLCHGFQSNPKKYL